MIFRTSSLFTIKIENCEFMQLTKENEIKIFKDKELGGKNGKLKTYIASLESTNEKYVPDEDDQTTPTTIDQDGNSTSKKSDNHVETTSENITSQVDKTQTKETKETKEMEKEMSPKRNLQDENELKRKRTEQTEIESTESESVDLSLKIPQWVKEYLHKDYIQVFKEEKEYPLVEKENKSVKGIIDSYLKANEEKSDFGILQYSMDGILQFFDACFEKPFSLLYLTENTTFKDSVGDEGTPSLVYGLPHLLRFCVSLPSILAKMSPEISLDPETISIIYRETERLFNYLEENLQNI